MPGHRDERERGGNGLEMTILERGGRELLPKRSGPGIRELGSRIRDREGAAASGPGTQTWGEGAEPGQPGDGSGSGRLLLGWEEHSVPPGAGK